MVYNIYFFFKSHSTLCFTPAIAGAYGDKLYCPPILSLSLFLESSKAMYNTYITSLLQVCHTWRSDARVFLDINSRKIVCVLHHHHNPPHPYLSLSTLP